jgi:D-arabinose 1-dehydrogenase-like Zn-dependent alcohol dehydrogenase
MDAYSISVTSLSRRNSSRIYQDLRTARISSIIDSKEITKRGKMSEDTPRKTHVGIVGAGISGLRCADVLLRHGFEVTIIEGRDRVGGRIHQETLSNGYSVDLGPNFIHGTEDNPILELARETNTNVGSWDAKTYVFDEGGDLMSVGEGEALSTVMWNIIEDAFKHSSQNCAEIDPSQSLMDFFQEKVLEHVPESEEGWERKREVVLQMAELWGGFVGSPITRQSLKFFWLEECIDGGWRPNFIQRIRGGMTG